MQCIHCKKEIKEGQMYCMFCGGKQTTNAEKSNTQAVKHPPVQSIVSANEIPEIENIKSKIKVSVARVENETNKTNEPSANGFEPIIKKKNIPAKPKVIEEEKAEKTVEKKLEPILSKETINNPEKTKKIEPINKVESITTESDKTDTKESGEATTILSAEKEIDVFLESGKKKKKKTVEKKESEEIKEKTKEDTKTYNANYDHYYDNVLPEIEENIADLKRDNIFRIITIVVVAVIILCFLIFFL